MWNLFQAPSTVVSGGGSPLPLEKLREHLARGEYVQARKEAERLIHVGELSGEDLVQAYRGAALAHYYLQEIFAAVKLGERALENALALEAWELIGRARYDLSEFYLTLGDTHQAREHLLEFLTHLDRYPQISSLEAKAHHNLALIFRQRREYENAVASHQMAANLFQRDGNLRLMMESIRGVIWCHLTVGDPDTAWPYIQQLSSYLEHHPDDGLSASLLTDRAYYHRQIGDLKASMDFCEEVLVPGRPGVDDHILATACVIAGENALDVGQPQEARKLADLALDFALKAKGPFLMNRASALRRRIHESEAARTRE